MGADVKLNGRIITNKVASYSVQEYATPIDVSSMEGGAGQITAVVEDTRLTRIAHRKELLVQDSAQGTTIGRVSSTSTNGFSKTLTADSRLIQLTGERVAEPFAGTLGGLIRYYLSLVEADTGVVIDSSTEFITVAAPGWKGSVMDALKRICAAYMIEMSLVSNNIVFRPVRERTATRHRDSSVTVNVDDSQLAQAVELIYCKTSSRKVDAPIYPLGGWNEDVQVFNVDADADAEFTIDLQPDDGEEGVGFSVESVEQPECIDFVGRYDVDASVYCVTGNDGLPIPPARWLDNGGSVTVEIGEDTRTLTVKVHGSREEELAPFRIAASAGTSDQYSSLRLIGTGIEFDRRKLKFQTGNNSDVAPTEVTEVSNDFIVGKEQAVRALWMALCSWTGPQVSMSVTTSGINRRSDNGNFAYATINDFNTLWPTQTFAQFSTEWTGRSIDDLNEFLRGEVENRFENQAFGNIAGARVMEDGLVCRITDATSTATSISYTAQRDTTIDDWNRHYEQVGLTFDDFSELAAGLTVADLGGEGLLDPTLLPDPPPAIYPDDGIYPDDNHYPSRS